MLSSPDRFYFLTAAGSDPADNEQSGAGRRTADDDSLAERLKADIKGGHA